MVIKVYISGMSGSKEVKKRQQRVSMIMDSKHIPYTIIDITEPGQEAEKDFMQKNSEHNGSTISDPTPRHPLPPQLFNDSEYCGDYDDFDLANEIDNLEVFLKLEAPKPVEVSPADEQQQKNGQTEPEEGDGDQVTAATEEADDENKENKTEEGANETTVDETIVEETVNEEKVEQSFASSVEAVQQDRTEDVAMEDETDEKPTVPAEQEGHEEDQTSCEPSPDGDMAEEVSSKDTADEVVELDELDSEDSQQKLEQTSETAEELLKKIDEDHDENSQQIREELIEKDEESVEKIEEDHHDDDSEEVVTVERTDEDEAEKLEGAKDPPEESSPHQEDIVDHEVDEVIEDSESGDDDDEDINSIKEVLKDDADQVVVDEEDGLVEEMLEHDPESEEAVEGKANFSTTDADEEDAEQRELLEAAAAMGKREDETEETAVGGAQAEEEEEEDVEIAEQEVSSRNVDV
uniref:SH3 domain-binding glutamic acid-rich protein homolog n=1 Tax=Culex pipiens TaxID=7175 RepID=A0A8D8A1H1_CULPI